MTGAARIFAAFDAETARGIAARAAVLGFGPVILTRRALEGATVVENEDGTVDLVGVEILSVGGPIHGIGSPPEGDYWTLEDLRAMAEADAELGDELVPPNKIGHPDEQTLVQNSIDAGELPADGELPAVGWLEDLRVQGTKLLADVRKVPRVVYELIDKGAYRKVSVELSKVTSQVSGKTYEWVVTGLAWLGGRMPAVRTLGDVAALYEGDVPVRRIYVAERELAAGDVAWSPAEGLERVRAKINEVLNPGPYTPETPARYWVRDVADGKALVEDWQEEPGVAWVIPYSIAGDVVTIPPSSDWTRAEEGWLEVGRANETRALTLRERWADSRAMKFSAEQRRKFAEATGLAEADVTDEILEAAGVAAETEEVEENPPTPPAPPAPEPPPTGPPPTSETERENATLVARVAALETQNRQLERRAFADGAIKAAKIAPGQRADFETFFDRDPDAARKFVEGLEPRQELLDELGANPDDDPDGEREFEDAGRDYQESASARLGIPAESIV